MKSDPTLRPWFILNVTDRFDSLSNWLKNKTTKNFQDWFIALLLVIGTCYILIQPFEKHSDKISNIVLWLTFVAILWSTNETYWLKHVTQKQLEEERHRNLIEIMPIIGVITHPSDS